MSQPAAAPSAYDLTPPSAEERQRLEAGLSREEAEVLLRHGTEAPFCGGLLGNKENGVYAKLHKTQMEMSSQVAIR